jgi:hypothetical protein
MRSPLEQRYRRLLRLYPADYRAQNEEELVGVLLDCAEPGRDRPTVRATVDLLRGALRCRLTRAGRVYDGQAWRDAAALFALLLTVCAVVGFGKLGGLFQVVWIGSVSPGAVREFDLWWLVIVPLVGWVLALAAVLFGGRRIRMATALLVVSAPMVAALMRPPHRIDLQVFDLHNRLLVNGLLMVVLLATAAPGRRLRALVGRWRAGILAAVSVGFIVLPLLLLGDSAELNFLGGPEAYLAVKWLTLVAVAALIFGFGGRAAARAWVLFVAFVLLNGATDVSLYFLSTYPFDVALAPVLFVGALWVGARWIRSRDASRRRQLPLDVLSASSDS